MKVELIKINPEEFGLKATEAKTVEKAFKPMLEKMNELEDDFNKIISAEINPETVLLARSLRLEYVKVRTGTEKIHKEAKAYYLAGGRFVDGWKNAQVFASQGKEKSLSEIENHFENLEKERLQKLKIHRGERLYTIGYLEPVQGIELMEDEVFESFLKGMEIQVAEKHELELKEKAEKLLKDQKEKIWYDRKIEIASFGTHALSQPFMDMTEEDYTILKNECVKSKETALKVEAEEKEKQLLALKEEKEKRERAEMLLADQRKAKELEDKKKSEQEAKNNAKSEKELFTDLIGELNFVTKKYMNKFQEEQNLKTMSNVMKLIAKVNGYIQEKNV